MEIEFTLKDELLAFCDALIPLLRNVASLYSLSQFNKLCERLQERLLRNASLKLNFFLEFLRSIHLVIWIIAQNLFAFEILSIENQLGL